MAAAGARETAAVLALESRENARHRQLGVGLSQMAQHLDLAVRGRTAGRKIDNLQNIFALIGGAEMEIAIALAG